MKASRILSIAIILVQLIDIVVHAGTGQIEGTRIAASLILVLWVLRAPNNPTASYTGLASLGIYLVLNLVFLWQNGLTNPATGGALRIPLFLLVLLSSALMTALLTRKSTT